MRALNMLQIFMNMGHLKLEIKKYKKALNSDIANDNLNYLFGGA